MLHRALQDPIQPADTEADTAVVAQTERDLERGERHLAMLAELADIGMRLARSLGALVELRIEREKKGEIPPGRTEDAASAVDKMAQTVRRTLALEAKLAEGVKARRQRLITDTADRRATRKAAHKAAVDDAILAGLHDAYAADCSDDEYHALAERLLEDARDYLGDADEMRGYLDRPVGETVARLCAAIGLDPAACEPDGDAWRVRRPPLDFEVRLEERARNYGGSSPASPSWGGTDAEGVRVGTSLRVHEAGGDPTRLHPDGAAVRPSP
jgi:hypothetical protein